MCQLFTCRNKNCGSELIMLCLGKQVCRNISRISCLICHNQDFTWSCNGINADMTVNCFLCKCYIDISRSYDLVNLRDTLCSVSKGCNCLCTADLVDLIHTGFFGCNQCIRTYFSIFSRRRYHDDLIHTGNLCRHHIHQYRRRINCLSSRHIHADSVKRSDLLPKNGSVRFTVKPAVLTLFCMITFDIVFCFADDCKKCIINLRICFFNFCICDFNRICSKLCPIKFGSVCKNCRIFFFFYFI